MASTFLSTLITAFLVGLLGGVHCVGMCGGLITAMSLAGTARSAHLLAYNLGRICCYALAGALVGAVGGLSLKASALPGLRLAFFVVANLLLIFLGLYLIGLPGFLQLFERGGQVIWRRIQPLSRRFLPVKTVTQAFALGLVWGFLPCALVYSVLATALTSGSAGAGALVMFAFGLGTLPNLMLAGLILSRFQGWVQRTWVRCAVGFIIIVFGLYGLYAALRAF